MIIDCLIFALPVPKIKTLLTPKIATKLSLQILNIPWGFVFLPDQSMLITEKMENLSILKTVKNQVLPGLPDVYVRGQGGFMDIILDPDYENNGWIYFSYASSNGEGDGGKYRHWPR